MADPLTWVAGYGGKKVLDWVLEIAFEKGLTRRLDQVVMDWSKSLPKDIHVVPSALFPNFEDPSMKGNPSVEAINRRLEMNRLPLVDEWIALITERRDVVRRTAQLSYLQPFFSAYDDAVRDAIVTLAKNIDRQCQQESNLFKGETLGRLEEIGQALGELSQKPKSYLPGDHIPLQLWYAAQNEQWERIFRNELNQRESVVPIPMEPHWAEFIEHPRWHDLIRKEVEQLLSIRSRLTDFFQDVPTVPAIDYSGNYDGIVQKLRAICSGDLTCWAHSMSDKLRQPTDLIDKIISQLNTLADQTIAPEFGICLLIVGDMGSGKTHFLSSILSRGYREPDRRTLVLIVRPRDIERNNLAEYLLKAICERTEMEWKSLDAFQSFLSTFEVPPKLVIAVDDLQTMPIDGVFLDRLKDFIAEHSQLHSLFYIFTLDHQSYVRIASSDSFWKTYGYGYSDKKPTRTGSTRIGRLGSWFHLDDLNWQQQTGVQIVRKVVKAEEDPGARLLSDLVHLSQSTLRHLTKPFIAWVLLDIRNQLEDVSLVDLNFINFISKFWETLLPRLSIDARIQTRLKNCTSLIASYLMTYGNAPPSEGELLDFIISRAKVHSDLAQPGNASAAVLMLERGGMLRGFDVPDSEFESIRKVELAFDVFWNWHLGRRLLQQFEHATVKNTVADPVAFLENWFRGHTDSITASGILDFFLLSLIEAVGLIPSVNRIWCWAAVSRSVPPGAVWFAASKTHGPIRDGLALSLLRPLSELRDQNRDLFGFIYFLASLSGGLPEGLTTPEIFALLKKYYFALNVASLSDYFIFTVRRCLPFARTIQEVVDTMVQLSGCEVMGVAEEAALLSIDALARFGIDCATLVGPVFEYLKAISLKWLDQSRPVTKERYYYREWVLSVYCRRLIYASGIDNAHKVLSDAGWYRADQFGVRQPLAREMVKESNFAFADWYRSASPQEEKGYILLVSRLAASPNRAEREAAFYMIRHTCVTRAQAAVRVDAAFRPVLAHIAADPELASLTSHYIEFLRVNDVLESANGIKLLAGKHFPGNVAK